MIKNSDFFFVFRLCGGAARVHGTVDTAQNALLHLSATDRVTRLADLRMLGACLLWASF
jgi:hypothetical protein